MPGRRLALFAAAGLPPALLDGGRGWGAAATLAVDASLLVVAWADGRAARRRTPSVRRHAPPRLVVGASNTVEVHLHNPSAGRVRVTVRDEVPDGWDVRPEEQTIELPPHARRTLVYEVRPPERGRAAFGDLALRVEGPVELGAAIVTVAAAAEVAVVPNVLGPQRYERADRIGVLRALGVRPVRAPGRGGEFEQLREYVSGDAYRDLDWKSTAKRQRPVTRVFQEERSQQVLLAIDAGRTMAPRLDGLTRLDHAINAALLLGYVALRRGDRVGLVVFADEVQAYVAPGRGIAQYRRLLEALLEVRAEPTAVDFRRFAEFVRARVPRRSLVAVFSDLLDEVTAAPLVEHMGVLRRRHLPVCVTMGDPVAEAMAARRAEEPADVFVRAAASDALAERAGVKARLRKAGVHLVEAPPGALAAEAVNRYLALKARQAL